jgi:hypothetical protein
MSPPAGRLHPEPTMTKAHYPEPDYADPEFLERRRVLDEMTLPRLCTHDEALELHRRSRGAGGAAARVRRPPHCHQCGHALPGDGPLRARDVPGLTHAFLFFTLAWTLYVFSPFPPLRGEVAMWTTWLVSFAVALRLGTPLRSARNALLILFALSWAEFFGRYWSFVTPGQLAAVSLEKFADCVFATTPIFFAAGMRAFIRRLKSQARAARDEF